MLSMPIFSQRRASLPYSRSSTVTMIALRNRFRRKSTGKPNYNMGPVKFGVVAAMFWGIAGFLVGVVIAFQLAYPALNFDLPWTNFGAHATPAAHLGGDLRLWRQPC